MDLTSDDNRTQRYRSSDVQSDAGSFRDLLLPPPLVQALAAAGFQRPSPVQKAAIPLGRSGCDMIVQAKSGTGKTAVFAAILLERVSLDVSTPQAVVMAPTRELAIQSFQVIERIAAGLPQPAPTAAVFVGGLPTENDEKRLRRTCHIVVGTPGRLTALLSSGALLTGRLTQLILDEADQLLGESFYNDVAWLHQQLPDRKQVLAFSATFTPELLADLVPLMRRPQKVLLCEETVSLQGIRQFYKLVATSSSSSSEEAAAVAAVTATTGVGAARAAEAAATAGQQAAADAGSDLVQDPAAAAVAAAAAAGAAAGSSTGSSSGGQQVSAAQQLMLLKVEVLLQLLSTVSFHQAVVFCNKKVAAEWLARRVTAAGCPAAHLSADMPQPDRMASMEAVRKFKVRVIVSTDVMARGVDFDRVNLVVNLDLPPNAATYVHRVGRTGRFGTRGVAVAVVTQEELGRLQEYLQAFRGGEISLLPESIPDDFYAFALESDWERSALQELLDAPRASEPPGSPPPLHKKHKPQQQQQAEEEKGYEDYDDEEEEEEGLYAEEGYKQCNGAAGGCLQAGCGTWQPQQQPQQQQQQQGDADYDPAEAWDAWAEYYKALGYNLPTGNPYRDATAGGPLQQQQWPQQQWHQQQWHQQQWQQQQWQQQQQQWWQHHQQQQGQVHGAAAASGAAPAAADKGRQQQQQRQQQHQQQHEQGEEEQGCELPVDDDECDPRALLLLSRLQVAPQAEAAAETADPAAAAADVVEQASPSSEAAAAVPAGMAHPCRSAVQHQQPQQQWPLPPRHLSAAAAVGLQGGCGVFAGPVCLSCWSQSFAAWRSDYQAWQQQYAGYCGWSGSSQQQQAQAAGRGSMYC